MYTPALWIIRVVVAKSVVISKSDKNTDVACTAAPTWRAWYWTPGEVKAEKPYVSTMFAALMKRIAGNDRRDKTKRRRSVCQQPQ